MKLTKSAVDRMAYGKRPTNKNSKTTYPQDIRWDNAIPGFGVRIYPTGKKSFVLYYRTTTKRQHIMTIGRYGVLTLDEARDRARKALAQASDGEDPLEIRQRTRRGETVKALCAEYMDRHAKPKKKTWKDDERWINKYILPAWGNHKVRSITHTDAAALHSKIGKTHPYAANRILELISKMFELARRWGYVDDDAVNPARDIDAFPEEKRDRWVTPQELPRLAEAIDQEPNLYARLALWLYLLTGMRKSEMLEAKWKDIDWERKELRLANTKAGRIHYVPLSEPAIAVLRQIPRIEGNPYIIVGKKEGSHLVNIYKPWNRIRKSAGVDDVRLHDLRRTLGSWMAQSGNSLHLIGRVLNHSSQATTAVYARFAQDNVRDALESHGKQIMGAAHKQDSAAVVDLRNSK